MVQKYQSPVRVYKYPFELIMLVSLCPPLSLCCLTSLTCQLRYDFILVSLHSHALVLSDGVS